MRILASMLNLLLFVVVIGFLLVVVEPASLRMLALLSSPLVDVLLFAFWFVVDLLVTAYRQGAVKRAFAPAVIRAVLFRFAFAALLYVLVLLANRHHLFADFISRRDYLSFMLPLFALLDALSLPAFEPFSWGRRRDLATVLRTGDKLALAALLKSAPAEIVNTPLPDGETPLTFVITYMPDVEVVSLLLEHGADPNLPNARGTHPVQSAVASGKLPIFEQLLRAGALTDFAAPLGNSLLHLAAGFGRKDMAERLLQQGAAVDAVNEIGETPLHIAARRGSVDTVELLLEHGADLHRRNNSGETPAFLAEQRASGFAGLLVNTGRGHVVRVLRKASH